MTIKEEFREWLREAELNEQTTQDVYIKLKPEKYFLNLGFKNVDGNGGEFLIKYDSNGREDIVLPTWLLNGEYLAFKDSNTYHIDTNEFDDDIDTPEIQKTWIAKIRKA